MPRRRHPAVFAAQQAAILHAAEACIRRDGFQGAGIAAICAEAGISAGRLYHYFPSKAAIIAALIDAAQAEALAAMAPLRADLPTVEGLVVAVAAAAIWAAHPDYAGVALEIAAAAARDTAIATAVVAHDRTVRAEWAAAIARGQAAGSIATRLPAEDLADLIGLILDGATGRRVSDPGLTDAALTAHIRHLLTPLLTGDPS